MYLPYDYEELAKQFPQEVAEVLQKIQKGKNKIKELPPNTLNWGLDYAVAIGLSHTPLTQKQKSTQDNSIYEYWEHQIQNGGVIMSICANSKYFSSHIKTAPKNIHAIYIDTTQKLTKDYLAMKTNNHNYTQHPIVLVEQLHQGHIILKEHYLLGSYEKDNNHNLLLLSDCGLLLIEEINNGKFNYGGAAANAFAKSIYNALDTNSNFVKFRNKKFNFTNPQDTLQNILNNNPTIWRKIRTQKPPQQILVVGFFEDAENKIAQTI